MKKLGFGFMRLPKNSDKPGDIDYTQVNEMVDYAMDNGFNVFDSGYGYMEGYSDIAIKKTITERYPRKSFKISNKLPIYDFTLETDMDKIFAEQLDKCGLEYFDYYLLHAITEELYENIVKKMDCIDYLKKLKEKGFINHIGISYHDNADFLDIILEENPEIEFVMLQLNYLDWINPGIQASKCYKIAKKHNVPIMVMEPLKGGTLVNIPKIAEKKLKSVNPDMSIASWGIRFVAGLDDICIVFSGMSSFEQIKDNISYMKNFEPLNKNEKKALRKVRKIISNSIAIDCTYCDYCLDSCEENIPISKFFSLYNDSKLAIEKQDLHGIYYENYAKNSNPASACTECGKCVEICPQHLDVIGLLKEVSSYFE